MARLMASRREQLRHWAYPFALPTSTFGSIESCRARMAPLKPAPAIAMRAMGGPKAAAPSDDKESSSEDEHASIMLPTAWG